MSKTKRPNIQVETSSFFLAKNGSSNIWWQLFKIYNTVGDIDFEPLVIQAMKTGKRAWDPLPSISNMFLGTVYTVSPYDNINSNCTSPLWSSMRQGMKILGKFLTKMTQTKSIFVNDEDEVTTRVNAYLCMSPKS